MKKYDIINGLAKRHDLRRYLEICTPSTGNEFHNIDRQHFATCERLMYNCPPKRQEQFPITYRAEERSSADLIRTVATLPEAPRYDIILVDGWHTYACTIIDLMGALRLLEQGGIIVVHDCDPRDPALASAEHKTGFWCGVAYAAFIDFVLPRDTIKYYTLDTDFGCGVIFTSPLRSAYEPGHCNRRELEFEWRAIGPNDDDRFAFYLANRSALLNLISPSEFLAIEGIYSEVCSGASDSLGIIGEVPLLPRSVASPDGLGQAAKGR